MAGEDGTKGEDGIQGLKGEYIENFKGKTCKEKEFCSLHN